MDIKTSFDTRFARIELALVQKAREFARQHLDVIGAISISSHKHLLQEACRSGLAGMEVPIDFGGASASFSTRMRVCEELALYHAGFAFSLVNHHNIVSRIAQSEGAEARRQLVAAMLDGRPGDF